MTCKKCIHYHKTGHVGRCEYYPNIDIYGDVGNVLIKDDCGHFKSNEPEKPSEKELYCNWRPIKKKVNRQGYLRFILQTDCGRKVEYSRGNSEIGNEIMTEVCSKCGRIIKVHYIRGME